MSVLVTVESAKLFGTLGDGFHIVDDYIRMVLSPAKIKSCTLWVAKNPLMISERNLGTRRTIANRTLSQISR